MRRCSRAASDRTLIGMIADARFAMLALGFASVPLYRMFCQATGYNGTARKALNGRRPRRGGRQDRQRPLRCQCEAGMDWTFAPERSRQARRDRRAADGLLHRDQPQRQADHRFGRAST
jgi:cytochrome c oxidase assembly protein subunit 11